MIFGEYPCCGGALAIPLADGGGFEKETCPHCGATVWHLHSRIDPQSWTDEQFLKEYVIDEATKSVRPLIEPRQPTPAEVEAFNKILVQEIADFLNGTGTGENLTGLIPADSGKDDGTT